MTRQPEQLACGLCGTETERTVIALVQWTEPIDGEIWDSIPRCVDRPACRARVELVLGEPWAVDDRTPAPIREPEPEPVAESPAPDVEEESVWA